jgi:hypothetical protein
VRVFNPVVFAAVVVDQAQYMIDILAEFTARKFHW